MNRHTHASLTAVVLGLFVFIASSTASEAPAVLNSTCPRSGKAVSHDSLTWYRGQRVGFCNTHCRDDFAAHVAERPNDRAHFDGLIDSSPVVPTPTDPRRHFDFWLGTWEVSNRRLQADGSWQITGKARAKISAVVGGRAILEEWTGQGSLTTRGMSLRTYDAEQKRWEILLNWPSGQLSGFGMMVGNFYGEIGEFYPPTTTPKTRFVFSHARQESCQWSQATSPDGATWTTNWIMDFRRVGPPRTLTAEELSISLPKASVRTQLPESGALDGLIGCWQATTERGKVNRRTSTLVDGLALVQLTSFAAGTEAIDVFAFHPQQRLWHCVGISTDQPDCYRLAGTSAQDVVLREIPASDNGVEQRYSSLSDESYKWSQTGGTSLEFGRVPETPAATVPEFSPSPAQRLATTRALLALQQADRCQHELAQLIAVNPTHPQATFFLGYVHHMLGEYEKAKVHYERAVELMPKALTVPYNLACLCAIQGDTDGAFELLAALKKKGYQQWQQVAADPDFASLRDDMRFAEYVTPRVSDDKLFVEPTEILQQHVGEAANDQFGWTARRAGDVDRDGCEDYVVSAPTYGGGRGRAYLYSGKSGALLRQWTGKTGERLSNSAVGCGDCNGDGVPDIVVGAPNSGSPGNAYIYSGSDGALLHKLSAGDAGDQFGYEVSELGDIDEDGAADVLVGALTGRGKESRSGVVYLYSGRDARLLLTLHGERTDDGFGNAAACARNKDGTFTLVIGANRAGEKRRGRVYVYRLTDGVAKHVRTLGGDSNSVHFGQMFLSFPGDPNADGYPDFFASDFSDRTAGGGAGKVFLLSGKDTEVLFTISGQVPGENLGTSVSDAGDVNGDGIGDLVIGAWQNGSAAPKAGRVYLHDGKDGALIRKWTCREAGDTFGFDACGIGDVNGDGHVDFLLTSAWAAVKGPQTGRVFVLSGAR